MNKQKVKEVLGTIAGKVDEPKLVGGGLRWWVACSRCSYPHCRYAIPSCVPRLLVNCSRQQCLPRRDSPRTDSSRATISVCHKLYARPCSVSSVRLLAYQVALPVLLECWDATDGLLLHSLAPSVSSCLKLLVQALWNHCAKDGYGPTDPILVTALPLLPVQQMVQDKGRIMR